MPGVNRARGCGPRPVGKCFSWKTPPRQPAGAALAGPEKRSGGAARADARRGEDFACGQNGPYCDSGRPVPPCRAACIAASNRPFPGRFCAPFAGLRLCGRCVSRYRPAVCVMLRKLRFLRPAMPAGAGKLLTASLLSCFFATQRPVRAPRRGSAAGCAPARKPMPMRAKKAAGVAEFGFFALTLQP